MIRKSPVGTNKKPDSSKKDVIKFIVTLVCLLALCAGCFLAYRYYLSKSDNSFDQLSHELSSRVQVNKKVNPVDDSATNELSANELDALRRSAMRQGVDHTVQASLRIPSIRVRLPIFRGANPYTLSLGVATFYRDDLPFGTGNMIIAGHSFSEYYYPYSMLTQLPHLRMGSPVYVKTYNHTFKYIAKRTKVIPGYFITYNGQPASDSPFANIKDGETPKLTLFCCTYRHGVKMRYTVQCDLASTD